MTFSLVAAGTPNIFEFDENLISTQTSETSARELECAACHSKETLNAASVGGGVKGFSPRTAIRPVSPLAADAAMIVVMVMLATQIPGYKHVC